MFIRDPCTPLILVFHELSECVRRGRWNRCSRRTMKPEFCHVRNILINTISLLCKNSLTYQRGLRIHGLLGITLDEEVFLVEISEHFLQNDPKCFTIVPAAGVKLEQEHDHAAVDGSENLSMTAQKNRRRNVNLKTSNESAEEIADSQAKGVNTGSQEGITTSFQPGIEVISIKEESMEADVIQNFFLENSDVSQVALGLVSQHLPGQSVNCSDAVAFTEAATEPKAENDCVEILADDPNQTGWNADAFADSSGVHGWLETSQNHLSLGLASPATVAEKRSRTQSYSLTADSRSPLVPDSVLPLCQRWSMTWSSSRRPTESTHKQFKCDIDDCTRSYYAKKNLLRHQTTVHGRVPMYRRPNRRSHF